MSDCREELLNRLTLAGWLLLIVDAFGVAILAPLVLARLFPDLFALAASSRRLMGVIWVVTVGAFFALGKVLLERCGIVVLRGKKGVNRLADARQTAGHEAQSSPPA
jgi:hypothetical protein